MKSEAGEVVRIEDCRLEMGRSGGKAVVFALESLVLGEGEQSAFTGPSGCGKSTLLNLVAGLRRPDHGSITVNGTSLGGLRAGRLDAFRGKTLGFVFQSFNLLGSFTALENVQIGMRFGRSGGGRERKAQAAELLESVGLAQRMHSYPEQLSAGERQRVAVARAVANRPRLLLADEPTGALDPETADEVFTLIRNTCSSQGCALMFVTHDLDLAARLPRQVDCRGLVHSINRKEAAA
jgi:putative ABC transport system ATP-binding protein